MENDLRKERQRRRFFGLTSCFRRFSLVRSAAHARYGVADLAGKWGLQRPVFRNEPDHSWGPMEAGLVVSNYVHRSARSRNLLSHLQRDQLPGRYLAERT